MGDPDRELVQRARDGDEVAFAELVDRHSAVVHRVAARVVGADDADDVAQDAFLRAFHRLERFRGESPFRAWLLRIVQNTALTALSRRPSFVAPADGKGDGVAEEGGRNPERPPAEQLEASERRARLEEKIRLLRPAHRAVLVLRDVEGLAYEEIAVVTEAPVGSVKGRLHRARGELVDLLRSNTYDWELPR